LLSRSHLIWTQSTAARRRGYFLAGVGLSTGHALDAFAADANPLLVQANGALLNGEAEEAIVAITALAEMLFTIQPFVPDKMPENWRDILRLWLSGEPLADIAAGQESETLQFVEGGLVYRLSWAMEAIRVRGSANGDAIGDSGLTLDDFELGYAVAAVETGTVNRSAAILIQAGFNSRLAAIKAVTDTGASFQTGAELHHWLQSEAVTAWSAQPDWPTLETKAMWADFTESLAPGDNVVWTKRSYWANVEWHELAPPAGMPVQIHHQDGQSQVLAPDGALLGTAQAAFNPGRAGLLRAQVALEQNRIDIIYLGPADLSSE